MLLLSLQDPITARAAEHFRSKTNPVDSRAARTYLEHLASRLSANITAAPAWDFEVVDQVDSSLNPAHEPFALDSGLVFVPRRLLLDVCNESELAGMIAHAMAHVTRAEATLMSDATIRVRFFMAGGWSHIPKSAESRYLAAQLAADQEAVRLTRAAGFDPTALAAYLSRAQPAKEEDRESRLAALTQAAGDTPALRVSDSVEFVTMQTEMRTLFPPPRKPSLYK